MYIKLFAVNYQHTIQYTHAKAQKWLPRAHANKVRLFFGLLLAEMTENDASFLFHFYWHFIKKNYRRTNYEKKIKKIINRIDTLVVCFGIDIHVRRHASVGCLWKDGRSFFQVPAPHALILLHCNNKGFQRAFWARA